MKMVKSLILGSAAGIVAMSGAQAADLPVKAKAVEYVRICSLYGAGFFYIPGTDTCIKLGGFIRVDVVAGSNSDDTAPTSPPGSTYNRFANAYTWRSREDMQFDTRTATEYGVVRTFSEVVFSWTDDTSNPSGTNALGTVYSQIGSTGFGQANNGSSGLGTAGALGVYYAFIQFAGFTMGKAVSPFSSSFVNYPGNNFDGLVGGGGAVTGVNQFIYTAQFGNGVSGTIGVQDPTQYYQAGVNNFGVFGTPNATGVNDQSGSLVPDIVGNIMVTQAWGNAQLSAAAHDNTPGYYANGGTLSSTGGAGIPAALNSQLGGHPDSRWGWAIQGSLSLNTRLQQQRRAWNPWWRWIGGRSRCSVQLRWSASVDPDLGWSRWLHSQLEPILEHQYLWCLCRGELRFGYEHWFRGGHLLRQFPGVASGGRQHSAHLQPELQHLAGWYHHPLDPGQEPDLLGRLHLPASGPEHDGRRGYRPNQCPAGRPLHVLQPGHLSGLAARTAQLLILMV
jgi:Porin subfamily